MDHKRRLVAIMFTDIQGYTRLMQQSEARAVSIRRRHRSIFEPTTLEFDGEVIQYYGDGTLSIFESTVQAVKCAYALQRAFQEEPVIPVRIGIHTGDILYTQDDIIGDCVNLASRIESMGVPGSVTLSGKVAEEIANQDDLPLRRLGSFHFKNDRRKREVFALDLPGLSIPNPKKTQAKLAKRPGGKLLRTSLLAIVTLIVAAALGIAYWQTQSSSADQTQGQPATLATLNPEHLGILPFTNRTNDPDQAYLVDGVHEAIIDELQEAGIKVKPRTTMLAYQNSHKAAQQICQELGIGYLVEGSLMRKDQTLTLRIKVIDPVTETYRWVKTFEKDFQDAYALYQEVTRTLAEDLELGLSAEAQSTLAEARTVDPQAYDFYLQGKYHLNLGDDLMQAAESLERAIAIEPEMGEAYVALVETYLLLGFGSIDPFKAHTQFRIYAQKAIELNPNLSTNHHLLAMIKIFSDLDWQGAERELAKALEASPRSSSLYDTYTQFFWALGKLDLSIKAGEKAVALDPSNHYAHCNLSWAYYYGGNLLKAQKQLGVTIDSFGTWCEYHVGLGHRMRIETSQDTNELLTIAHQLEQATSVKGLALAAKAYIKAGEEAKARKVLSQVQEIGKEQPLDPWNYVALYINLGELDTALDIIEEGAYKHSFLLMYTLKADPKFAPLREHPRFKAIIASMNLNQDFTPMGDI
ncbi:MAG: adenylate/guanylate cyclase domain-containing protein [Bacteroidota bacterium]